MVYCSYAMDVAVSINTTYKIGCCDWILIQPCTEVDNSTCAHVIVISLWLIWYIQCGNRTSYLSIPRMTALDRCNISHIFTFFFNFNVVLCFEHWKRVSVAVGGVIHICFKFGVLNFSPYLWSFFLLVPNNWDLLWLLVLSLSFSLLLLWLLFFYTRNQYNYLISYYSFICYLKEEHLLLRFQFWFHE